MFAAAIGRQHSIADAQALFEYFDTRHNPWRAGASSVDVALQHLVLFPLNRLIYALCREGRLLAAVSLFKQQVRAAWCTGRVWCC